MQRGGRCAGTDGMLAPMREFPHRRAFALRAKLSEWRWNRDRMDLSDQLSAEHRDLLLELSLQISERRGVDELFMPFARHISARASR